MSKRPATLLLLLVVSGCTVYRADSIYIDAHGALPRLERWKSPDGSATGSLGALSPSTEVSPDVRVNSPEVRP
jgi:hypothetical protein